jgi:Dolichyl-phosphate-mannose-protein mannosyltransferase
LQLIRRLRLPAIFCALCVLVCELIARPYTTMGVGDDGPYILMARTLASTGHIIYNGWAAPMLGWQLYLGAAFIKLFGFSFTTVRMSAVLVAMVMAFVLQRALVAASISERNATLATLAFVLSPLYLMLSATFETDIYGLFSVVICLYGCLRALQSTTSRSTIAWLCFAIATNAIFGTSRQIGWLGILVMVPSTLWLLRAKRLVLLAGAIVNLTGAIFIAACMHWLKLQPYVQPESLRPAAFPIAHTIGQLSFLLLDIPFLLLPIVTLFFPAIRKSSPRVIAVLSAMFLGYLFLATYPSHLRGYFSPLLEPTSGNLSNWICVQGTIEAPILKGRGLAFFHPGAQVLLTILSFGGLTGLVISLLRSRETPQNAVASSNLPWRQLGILLGPFALAYILLLVPRATDILFDRYLLPLLLLALLCLARYYQERIDARLPLLASLALTSLMAICGIAITHSTFSLNRARVALAAELRSNGVPDTSVDNGWDYNILTEIQQANHINNSLIVIPADAYTPTPPLPAGTCPMWWYDKTPHIHPLYGIAFNPNVCYGPAPFAPVHYSRWPYRTPGTLYIVNYLPPTKP